MSRPYEYPNDSEDERAANARSTLAAREAWVGLANSTTFRLRAEAFNVADVITPEEYKKVKVPADCVQGNKLVDIKLYKVGNWLFEESLFFQIAEDNSEPKLFHTSPIEVKHGLIVIKDDNGPEGLKVETV